MCYSHEEGKKRNNGKKRTTKSRKNQNAWRKVNLKVLENIGSRQHQASGCPVGWGAVEYTDCNSAEG